MRYNLNHLVTLREFARQGTLAAAAERLSYTPGAVSQQIAALERAVGSPVVTPSGRHLVLTDVGRALVEHSEAVLQAEESAHEAVAQAQSRAGGSVTLGVWGSTAAALLSPVLALATRRHPGLRLHSREVDVDTAALAVRRRDVDLAFGLDYPDWPLPRDKDVRVIRLREERFAIAVSSTRPPVELTDRVSLTELSEAPWILPDRDTAMGRALICAFRRADLEPQVAHEVNDTAISLQLAAQGLGLAPVTELMLQVAPRTTVRRVTLEQDVLRHVVLIAPAAAPGRPSVDALIETVQVAVRRHR